MRRINAGYYEIVRDVAGEPATFHIERIERGDTAFSSDIGLWAVHVDSDPGEPNFATLRDAKAYVLRDGWYRDPRWGVCMRGA